MMSLCLCLNPPHLPKIVLNKNDEYNCCSCLICIMPHKTNTFHFFLGKLHQSKSTLSPFIHFFFLSVRPAPALNLNRMMSPSSTTYSLPFCLYLPLACYKNKYMFLNSSSSQKNSNISVKDCPLIKINIKWSGPIIMKTLLYSKFEIIPKML